MGHGTVQPKFLAQFNFFDAMVAGFMTTGVSTFQDPVACSVTVITCVVFQGSSKVCLLVRRLERKMTLNHIGSDIFLFCRKGFFRFHRN